MFTDMLPVWVWFLIVLIILILIFRKPICAWHRRCTGGKNEHIVINMGDAYMPTPAEQVANSRLSNLPQSPKSLKDT
jgi:hypothetical protein